MTKKKRIEDNGWMPYLMTPEEVMTSLDSKGISYEICDTPVPVLGNKVNCGAPLDSGEQMIDDYYYVPKSVVGMHPVMDMPAQGDSMIDADIHEGDILRLEMGAMPRDGDIVLAEIDKEYTAKVFFTDDQHQKWLLPMNEKYSPILLTSDKETRIPGVVRSIVKKTPRLSFSECAAIVNRAKAQKSKEGDVFQRLTKAVREGRVLFWAASAWAVVYCVARDCCGYEDTQFEPSRCGGFIPIERVYSLDPAPDSLSVEARSHILGTQANLWTEYMTNEQMVEYQALPRMSALAEVQWTQPERKDYKAFLQRLTRFTSLFERYHYTYAKHLWPDRQIPNRWQF